MRAGERCPLPREEWRLIVGNVLAGDALMVVLGIVLGAAASALAQGSWQRLLPGPGWWDALRGSLSLGPAAIAVPAAMLVASNVADRLLWPRSERYRAQVRRIRQGVSGELPRMAPPLLLALLAAVGVSEEALFRYGLAGLVLTLCSDALGLPWEAAAALAVAVSSALFALAHVQYENTFGTAVVLVIGIVLACFFLATGSLLSCAVAHWLYDFGDCMVERFRMARDPDYFEGAPPVDALRRQLADRR